MFERPQGGEQAVLIHIDICNDVVPESIDEFKELVRSAGVDSLAIVTGKRKVPNPKYFIGTGKLEELRICIEQTCAQVALFNHNLSPTQERSLEHYLQCRVLDRTGLILDIFAQRAKSHEGRLQVELAQLQHISSRLVRGWSHLERQKGGIGLRGPGETQLETDRRLIGHRITHLNKKLIKVRKRRGFGRAARLKADLPTAAIVGYTNSGKSTLFNRLTSAGVYTADQQFATLDPILRRIELLNVGPLILADTVGFIRDLPHDLVAAFRSTLEETQEASVLLHVIDASSDLRLEQISQVNSVLKEINADRIPQIKIYNKIDLMDNVRPHMDKDGQGIPSVWLSAKTGKGMDLLIKILSDHFTIEPVQLWLRLSPRVGALRSKLYQYAKITCEKVTDNGEMLIKVSLGRDQYNLLSQDKDFQKAIITPSHA